jgi:hypothetical protein
MPELRSIKLTTICFHEILAKTGSMSDHDLNPGLSQ